MSKNKDKHLSQPLKTIEISANFYLNNIKLSKPKNKFKRKLKIHLS